MSQSRNAEELKRYVQKTRKVNGQTLDNDIEIKNVESADKLKTARTIGLIGAVKSTPAEFDGSDNVSIRVKELYEGYLEFGGRNRDIYLSALDIALLPELNANRLAFIKDSAVKFEQSADNGETWTDVSDSFDGTMLCTKSISFGNGNTATDKSINRQHRITIDCVEGGLYCELVKILLQIDTGGATGCKCKVEFGDNSENTVWTTDMTADVFGWSGWNALNVNPKLIGKTYIRYVRLTFSISNVNEQYNSNLSIMSLRFISRVFYGEVSNEMARRGELYSCDMEQNATFPKNLYIDGNTLKIGNTTLTETQLQELLKLI